MGYIAEPEEIRSGQTTDIYFRRTLEILEREGLDKVSAKAEIFLKSLPDGYQWGVFSGLEDALDVLEGRRVDVRALPEGSLFFPGEPVMVIQGPYVEYGELETAVLGILCQASGIATKAARVKQAACGKVVLSFGARRMHPALSPFIDRNAYLGGVDGVSVVLSAEKLGIDPSGTIPHALILIMGDTLDAMRAFHEVVPPHVDRICLIDTLQDEKFEAVRIADSMGKDLYAVRIDTPASRRGDFRKIIEEVRWELDVRGHGDVKIVVSGGLSEKEIEGLADSVDGFGVGTCISNAPVMDFSMDLVEVSGKMVAKRGKMSGGKEIRFCEECSRRVITLEGEQDNCVCGGKMESLFSNVLSGGTFTAPREEIEDLRSRVSRQITTFGEGV